MNENVAVLIPYRGYQGSFRYYSIADIMADRIKPEELKGKIVLVGTTAPGLLDLRATPVGEVYPGVEIHANLIAGMLDGTIKQKPAIRAGRRGRAALAGRPGHGADPALLSPLRATLVSLVVLLFVITVNLIFWHYGNLVLPLGVEPAHDAGLVRAQHVLGLLRRVAHQAPVHRTVRAVRAARAGGRDGRRSRGLQHGGRKAELTVLFSDIRGFTTISEGLGPEELSRLMNEYLTAMTEVVRKNRGTLDKYIGDAIMAFWGAPVSDPEHARHAVITALEMQAALPALQPRSLPKGWPEMHIGVGVNTGDMTVGDMGSPVRKAYTVMGDAVNLGSRLEGITKQYGVGIIVGETTREAMKDIVFRELDRVRVKGKDEPVAIYEPIGLEGETGKAAHEEIKLWNQALRSYRAQDWDQAEVTLLNLSRMAPGLGLYGKYMERVAQLRREPPEPGWDGVWTFETK